MTREDAERITEALIESDAPRTGHARRAWIAGASTAVANLDANGAFDTITKAQARELWHKACSWAHSNGPGFDEAWAKVTGEKP